MKYLLQRYRSSLNFKITLSTILIVIIGVITIILYTQLSVSKLSEHTLETMDSELDAFITSYYQAHLAEIVSNVDYEFKQYLNEMEILGDTVQTYFNHAHTWGELKEALRGTPYFQDALVNNGNWIQNVMGEPSTVFMGRYLLDENGEIPPEIIAQIEDSAFMDLFLPSFAKLGAKKVQVYFMGSESADFTRMSPWKNIGESVYDVYPELYDQPIWETFNPGILKDWHELRLRASGRLIRTSKPVQDGITGEIILGLAYPIWSLNNEQFIGQMTYDIPLSFLLDYIEGIQLGDNGFALITQSNGQVLAVNPYGHERLGLMDIEQITETGFNTLDIKLSDSRFESIKSLVMSDFQQMKEIDIDGNAYYMISKPAQSFLTWSQEKGFYEDKWTVALVLPKEEVYAVYLSAENQILHESKNVLREQMYIAIIITFFVLTMIILYNSKLTRKLNEFTIKVKEIKGSGYTTHFEIESEDEIGNLSEAFNEMQHEIKETIFKLNVQNERLKEEIDERIKKDRMIDYLENFDGQTDLLNTRALQNLLKELSPNETYPFVSLVSVGIDELRKINDAYSFKIGDEIIQNIAKRLESVLDQQDLLFRLGGDEFGLLLKSKSLDTVITKCDEIVLLFKKPVTTSVKDIRVGCSIGISSYPNDTQTPSDLFKFTNIALNHAKEGNRGSYEFYSAHMNDKSRKRLEMINALNDAVAREEFHMVYQPIIDLKTQKTTALEALIRWDSPQFGLVPPDAFISLVEETKQIIGIGEWVLKKCMSDYKLLAEHHLGELSVAINISVVQFYEPTFVSLVESLVEQFGIDASRLTFEVTEGMFLNDFEKASQVITALRNLGIQFSIDDFGTGYSSLSYLKNLPLNHLKIDRTFIKESKDQTGWEIVNAIIGLANSLKLKVIAEGIETTDQLADLIERGCDEGQGYHFSRPKRIEDIIAWLKA